MARYGINRTTLATCIDPNAGPSDEQLDAIFGPLRGPGVTPDERDGIGTSIEATATATA